MTSFKKILRILIIAAPQFFAANAWALPTLIDYAHFTDRRGPSSIPGANVGDKIQIGAFLDSSDPVGSPTISIQATQGSTTVTLDPISPNFVGQHHYYKFIDFDPNLTGTWELIPADSTGTGPSAFTSAIAEPEFLPLVENITVQGTPLGTQVAWMLPNLDGFDVDGLWVGIVEVLSVRQVWGSDILPLPTTSLDIPAGVLEVGFDYAYAVQLGDFEGGNLENVSRAFSDPIRLTVTGDYNQNGTVDAADYTVWRDNLGGGALINRGADATGPIGDDDYQVWKANFGQSLGAGSNSTFAIPEPGSLVPLLLGSLLAACSATRTR